MKINIFDVLIPSEETNILQFNHYLKSDKMSYIIYSDLEFLIKRIDGCKNNYEKSSATKKVNIFLLGI